MKRCIIFGAFLLMSMMTFSQELNLDGENLLYNYQNVLLNTQSAYAEEKISGSPYTTDNFILGSVTGYKQKYLLRYDAFKDQIQVKDDKNQVLVVRKEVIKEVVFNDGTKYKVFDYTLDGKQKNGYLQVLSNNTSISLLKKEVIRFYRAKKAQSGYEKAEPAAYKKGRDRYLVTLKNGTVVSFNKKKDFLMLFPEKKKEIEAYIKSNKIKFIKDKDLIRLVNHVSSIL